MGAQERADLSVRIVTENDDADLLVRVVGDQVVETDGATPGAVLVVQPDGSLAPAPVLAAIADLAASDAPTLYTEAEQQAWRNALIAKVNAILAALRSADIIQS